MGGGISASCDEEHSELVVGGVGVASGGVSASFDDSVDGFGGVRCWCVFLGRESSLRSPLSCVASRLDWSGEACLHTDTCCSAALRYLAQYCTAE